MWPRLAEARLAAALSLTSVRGNWLSGVGRVSTLCGAAHRGLTRAAAVRHRLVPAQVTAAAAAAAAAVAAACTASASTSTSTSTSTHHHRRLELELQIEIPL